MAANVETMFSVRERPWHGLGTVVESAPSSKEALELAGLDWQVHQKDISVLWGRTIPGYKANVRDTDGAVLGVVTDKYRVVQNEDAFAFTDELLGEGVKYETAGSLNGGKKVWILARLPREYVISGERISPYLVFSNTHDGSGAIRVVCNNTLNLALARAERSFSMIHTGNINEKFEEAKKTLFMADTYMEELGKEFERLRSIKVSDAQVEEYVNMLIPLDEDATATQIKNARTLRNDILTRYFDAPDLKVLGKNAYRFVNAASDFATHANPLRRTVRYKENLFAKTVDGNPFIDRAYQLVA